MTRKKRPLTDEEQSLWDRVAQNIKPLKVTPKTVRQGQLKRRYIFLPAPPEPSPFSKGSPGLPSSTCRIQRVRNVKVSAHLDLHGCTREQARLRLAQFLISCQEQRRLWVLVITGKGQRHLGEEGSHTRSKQTLRELVPQWLEEAALRSVVSAYATAKPQDGGAGALYVRLNQRRLKDQKSCP